MDQSSPNNPSRTYGRCRITAAPNVLDGKRPGGAVLYAILCYNDEAELAATTRRQGGALLAGRAAIERAVAAAGRLGPVVRLMPTSAAVTVRAGHSPRVLDGPFTDTKEQLQGICVIECDTLQAAIEAAHEMAGAGGALEIRPLRSLEPNTLRVR